MPATRFFFFVLKKKFFFAKVEMEIATQRYAGPCCAASLCCSCLGRALSVFKQKTNALPSAVKEISSVDVWFALPWFRPNKRTIRQLKKLQVFILNNSYILKNFYRPPAPKKKFWSFFNKTIIVWKTLTLEKMGFFFSLFRQYNKYIIKKLCFFFKEVFFLCFFTIIILRYTFH